MIQNTIVALVVLAAVLYAVRSLAPARWLGERSMALSGWLQAKGLARSAAWVDAYGRTGGGCASGCGECEVASSSARPASKPSAAPAKRGEVLTASVAPASENAGTGAGVPALTVAQQPVRFVRMPAAARRPAK